MPLLRHRISNESRHERGRVLVTSGELVGVLAAVRGLNEAGFQAYSSSSRRRTYTSLSNATAGTALVHDAGQDPDGFVADLVQAALEHEIDLVIPGSERDLIALTDRRWAFPETIRLAVPRDPALLDSAMDKRLLPQVAAEAELLSPPSMIVHRKVESSPNLPTPWMIKPRRSETRLLDGRLVHGTTRCVDNLSELQDVLQSLPGDLAIVQTRVAGPLCAVAGVSWKGKLLCAEQRVADRTWPPDCGQMAYAESCPVDASAWQALSRVTRLFGWTGIVQLQFIDAPEGRYLIDLNPRIYASMGLALASGVNFPAIWAELELSQNVDVGEYRPGVRFRSEPLDVRVCLTELQHGHVSPFKAAVLPRRGTAHAVFSATDPLPLRALATDLLARAVRRVRPEQDPIQPARQASLGRSN
jgi:predicted ATP-grasp superfamily ATP-dependent carboligase